MNESSSPDWHAWPPEERNARLASQAVGDEAEFELVLFYHDGQQVESDEALSMFTDLVR